MDTFLKNEISTKSTIDPMRRKGDLERRKVPTTNMVDSKRLLMSTFNPLLLQDLDVISHRDLSNTRKLMATARPV
ncbi:hypothetical protein [Metallosphaera tengchongensis]|uniref:hypothetical protein n=1 Tax=Metallosphaera tengchongensis TaxID=1532350 RepID=UPI001FEA3371|nr:hypothetical protein [Metallosphaera tengchongensis]